MVAALGDRLRAPGDPLAAGEELAHELVRLQLLQHVVHGELDVARLEPGDEAEREHVVAHRVDEGAAELPVLRALAQRPAHRVDDVGERLRHLPDLLDAERPDLRLLPRQAEAVDRGAGEVALRPLGQDRHLRGDVRARLERAERAAVAAEALVARADAVNAAVVDEQLLRVGLRQHRRAERLGLLRQEAAQLRDGDDPVAVVLHRRRRRDPHALVSAREQVDGLAVHLAVGRQVAHRQAVAEEAAERARVDDRAREEMRAGCLALLDDGDRYLAQALRRLRRLLQQLPEPDRAGEPGRPGADDQDTDLDPLRDRIGRRRDHLGRRERRRVVRRADAALFHPLRARTSSVSFGTIVCRSPTTPRSANSKIGAFGSLLIATIVFELCIPTLCWIAPEMPHAM